MKKLLIFLLLPFHVFLQNLVSNGSFEEYSICPNLSGQIEYAVGWFDPDATNLGSPDFFHACSPNLGTPACCAGYSYQIPKTGVGFVGVWNYADAVSNRREYIQTYLNNTLQYNLCYSFSMYINTINWVAYGIDKFGVYLSSDTIGSNTTNTLLEYTPQVYSTNVIFDTVNWIQISGFFKANGNENVLTIGNFFSDDSIQKILFNDTANMGSYYLIDDVSLFQLGEGYAGKDSTILLGESIFLGQEVENLPSTWRILDGAEIANNVSGVLVSPTETTSYVCEQNFCGEMMYDTITITVVNNAGVEESSPLPPSKGGRVKVFPNPSDGSFELTNLASEILPFTITNTLGQVVYQDDLPETTKKLNLSLEKGVYFLNVGLFSEKMVVW